MSFGLIALQESDSRTVKKVLNGLTSDFEVLAALATNECERERQRERERERERERAAARWSVRSAVDVIRFAGFPLGPAYVMT